MQNLSKSRSESASKHYRGISLCNAICKLIDPWILQKSSNLQFAFKPAHSTSMCTSLVKEIIGYYNNHNSVVYACLVDATKAFDRLNYGKLFQLLLDRGMPKVIMGGCNFI